jgi:polyisoprenoid-binding protein YceI
MPRPLALAIAGAALVVVLVGAGAYAYFFSPLRTAPRRLALTSPASTSSATPAAGDLTGQWTVAKGSRAGYRVKEQFVGQTSTHEAVARTSSVSGGVNVQQTGGGLQATGLRVAAQLADLHSVDQVEGRDVALRDRFVGRTSLAVQEYPAAVFQASTIALPSGVASGQTVTLSTPGQLTIHGVTRDVTARVDLRMAGGQVEAVGSTTIDMRDFGVNPPQVPFTTSDSGVVVEFQLVLTHA